MKPLPPIPTKYKYSQMSEGKPLPSIPPEQMFTELYEPVTEEELDSLSKLLKTLEDNPPMLPPSKPVPAIPKMAETYNMNEPSKELMEKK